MRWSIVVGLCAGLGLAAVVGCTVRDAAGQDPGFEPPCEPGSEGCVCANTEPACVPGCYCIDGVCQRPGSDPDPNPPPPDDDPSGGQQFIPMGDALLENMCDIWADECPDGEKCTAFATAGSYWDANACREILGDQQPGEPCTAYGDPPGASGLDDCAEGGMCWDVDPDTHQGWCIEFCTGDANKPVCPSGGACSIPGSGVLPLCTPTCDPLQMGADCPNPENLCLSYYAGDGFICVLDASGGQGVYGSACKYANSCNQGLFCAEAKRVPGCPGMDGCCTSFCDVGEPEACPDADLGQVCEPWWEPGYAPEGYAHVGGCLLPSG